MLEYNEVTHTYELIDEMGYNELNNMTLEALCLYMERNGEFDNETLD